MSSIIPIILAGGQGMRLWPTSLPHIPKQFLTIGKHSLMQDAISRALAVASDEVLVVTNVNYLSLFSEKLSIPPKEASRIHLIGETDARNTAPAIALALEYIEQKYSDAIALVITADHLITPQKKFIQDVKHAVTLAKQNKIVTFGIVPTFADIGYGYIECGKKVDDFEKTHFVKTFREKPDSKTAQQYIDCGNFLWNSGMFCFSVSKMKNDMYSYCPKLAKDIFSSHIKWNNSKQTHYHVHVAKNIAYKKLEKISIDYAVMEHAQNIVVIHASFFWNDIGSWEEVAILQKNNQDKKSLIYTSQSKNVNVFSDIPVGICGLNDIIVVVENNRVLVMKKGSGQLVKNIAISDLSNKT